MFEQLIPSKDLAGTELSLTSTLSRKCSNCGKGGHNSRTCLELRDGTAVASLENANEVISQVAEQHREQGQGDAKAALDSAASEDSANENPRESRKKGVAWTEEEHRLFLLGLKKLGRGDWRGISRHFVPSRSPTQVASHAQKYFIRQSVAGKRKRRSSLFDLVPDTAEDAEATSPHSHPALRKMPEPKFMHSTGSPQTQSQMFASMVQAEAYAMAYYYHSMMAQQSPLTWMQAMCGQPDQPQELNPYVAQGFMVPRMMTPAGYGGLPGGPAANDVMQSQALAFMAQQQLAAAMAMGAFPFGADPLSQQHTSTLTPGAQVSSKGGVAEASEAGIHMDRQSAKASKATRVGKAQSVVEGTNEPTVETDSKDKPEPCFSGRSATKTEGNLQSQGEPPLEQFGHGSLVRPKAQKATLGHNVGELPSYMQSSQDTQTVFISGSAESQSTGARFPLQQLNSVSARNEASNSTGDLPDPPGPKDLADLLKARSSSPEVAPKPVQPGWSNTGSPAQ